uniref:HMG-box protein STE11 n=1 Tax=Pneumocystis carinii TaxID=4754 RepID=STE11_PNECA|nr:RecName: Full=HMG-box protein STE11 [Pneumocystis carinii]AAP13349.1 HMG-box protein STE11 [Pneumocystis carinii]
MLGRDIESDWIGNYWGRDHSLALNTFSKMSIEKEGVLYQKDFFVPYDGLVEELPEHSIEIPEIMGQDLLNDRLNSVEDVQSSYYGRLMPGLNIDLSMPTFPVSNELPVRLSSPIQMNLSTSMPNPTIEQLHSKTKSYVSQNPVNMVGSLSGSPPTDCHSPGGNSNTCGTLKTRALSLSPVSSDTAAKKKSPSRSGSSSSGIKRPLNSFMLYRRDKQSSIPTNNHQSISRIIGEMWKRETIEEKERYAEMAQRERERHAKEYPDYKFLPRKKKDRSTSGKSPRRRKTFDPSLEQDESKVLRMMLNQISHKKSQSDAEKFKLDQYSWLLSEEGNYDSQKGAFDIICQANTNSSQTGLPHSNQPSEISFIPGIYTAPNSVPLPIFPVKNKVEKVDTHNSLDGYLHTFDNLSDYEFRSLINNHSTPSVNDSRLGTSFNKSCTDSPQSISIYDDIKNLDIFSEKKETPNVSLVPTFDSTIFQDDSAYGYDNFTGIWDDPSYRLPVF